MIETPPTIFALLRNVVVAMLDALARKIEPRHECPKCEYYSRSR